MVSSARQGLVPCLVLIATVLFSTVLVACDLTSNAPKDGGIIDLGPSDQQVVDASVGSEASAVELGIDAASGGDGGSDSGGSTTCASACHGSATSTAPPVSTKGLSATSERGVGAHQAHLKTSSWHVAVSCDDCHLVPKAVADKGHIDTPLPAELIFSAAAKADGAKPAFNGTTCSGTYCHGATLSG
ncbi:MAG: hypothetical protein KKD66_26835, partial [Proteobacteria bacterium]|nr:hypothetical protein [Pseudomonadota bacterium]